MPVSKSRCRRRVWLYRESLLSHQMSSCYHWCNWIFLKSQAQYGSFRFFVRKEALQAGLLALEPPARSPASQPSPWAAGSQLVPRVSAEQSPPLEAALTAFLALGSFPPCALHGACQTSSPTLSPTPAVWLDLHQTCGPCVLLPQPPGLLGTQTPSAGVH